uniref:Uncharacterized protein n=1 Tax=Glossina pallidipes TaxID=7398 RepID=A0A1A9ZVC2_GLOPL
MNNKAKRRCIARAPLSTYMRISALNFNKIPNHQPHHYSALTLYRKQLNIHMRQMCHYEGGTLTAASRLSDMTKYRGSMSKFKKLALEDSDVGKPIRRDVTSLLASR